MALRSPFGAAHGSALRSIYLKVKPAPASLSESRAVLRALKQHGKIEVFKKLRDPSSFISVAGTRAIADDIISQSPLQFDCVDQTDADAPPGLCDEDGQGPSKDPKRTFTVEVFPAPSHPHQSWIKSSPLYGPWPETPAFQGVSFTTAALRAAVPKDMAFEGLADWETGGQNEDRDIELPDHRRTPKTSRDFIEQRRRNRLLKQMALKNISHVGKEIQ